MLETFQTVYLDNSVYTFTQITGPKSFALQRVFKSLRLKNVCQTETFFASNETGGIYEANSPFSSTIFRGKKSLFHVCARSAIAPKRKTKKVFWKSEMILGWPKSLAHPKNTPLWYIQNVNVLFTYRPKLLQCLSLRLMARPMSRSTGTSART